jgi:hypothetical protein
MKGLLACIVDYKLNPTNFSTFVDTFTTLIKDSQEKFPIYYKAELTQWVQQLKIRQSKEKFSTEDHEIILAILHQIERLLVHEMVFMPKPKAEINRGAKRLHSTKSFAN